jgi:hypothetical protein
MEADRQNIIRIVGVDACRKLDIHTWDQLTI